MSLVWGLRCSTVLSRVFHASDEVLCFQGPIGVAGLKGGRGTQGAPVRLLNISEMLLQCEIMTMSNEDLTLSVTLCSMIQNL